MKKVTYVLFVALLAACGGSDDSGMTPGGAGGTAGTTPANTGGTTPTNTGGTPAPMGGNAGNSSGGTAGAAPAMTGMKVGSGQMPTKMPAAVNQSVQKGDPEFQAALDELCQSVVDWVSVNDDACEVDSELPSEVTCAASTISDLLLFNSCVTELVEIECSDWIVEDENDQLPSCYELIEKDLIQAP